MNWIFIFMKVWAFVVFTFLLIVLSVVFFFYHFSNEAVFILPTPEMNKALYNGVVIHIYIIAFILLLTMCQYMY